MALAVGMAASALLHLELEWLAARAKKLVPVPAPIRPAEDVDKMFFDAYCALGDADVGGSAAALSLTMQVAALENRGDWLRALRTADAAAQHGHDGAMAAACDRALEGLGLFAVARRAAGASAAGGPLDPFEACVSAVRSHNSSQLLSARANARVSACRALWTKPRSSLLPTLQLDFFASLRMVSFVDAVRLTVPPALAIVGAQEQCCQACGTRSVMLPLERVLDLQVPCARASGCACVTPILLQGALLRAAENAFVDASDRAKLRSLAGDHWCETAEFARYAQREVLRIRAVHEIRLAEQEPPSSRMLLEGARLLWDSGDRTAAVRAVHVVADRRGLPDPRFKPDEARVLLQLAQWHIMSEYGHDEITPLLKDSIRYCGRDSELKCDAQFCFAQ